MEIRKEEKTMEEYNGGKKKKRKGEWTKQERKEKGWETHFICRKSGNRANCIPLILRKCK